LKIALPHRPLVVALAAALGAGAAAATPEPWTVAGRQGMILQVIVPTAQAKERSAYQQQIEGLCRGRESCFINFYTNTGGAPLAVPLPDAIANEPTAVLRRSAKHATESFRWSCRMALPEPNCF
jgi:hypothetical protein